MPRNRVLDVTAGGPPPSAAAIEAWLVQRLAKDLGVAADAIDLDRTAESYGLDSLAAVEIGTDLGDWVRGRELRPDTLWLAPSLRALCRELAASPGTAVAHVGVPPPVPQHEGATMTARAAALPKRVRPAGTVVGIDAIEYVLPTRRVTLAELAAEGRISSSVDSLAEMGFSGALMSDVPANRLAHDACRKLIDNSGIDPGRIGLLVNACAVPISALANGDRDWGSDWGGSGAELKLLTYSSCRLQHELGLVNARALGVGEMASMCLLGAVRTTQAIMALEQIDYAICVEADVFPAGCNRELVYNVVSDGACAVLLALGGERNRILGYEQITKGFYWDPLAQQNEMISAYFVTARRAIEGGLHSAGMTLADIDLMIPANISKKSWNVLAGMLGFPIEKVYLDSIGRQAHSVGADNYINFKDLLDAGRLASGQVVLMYSFGVGAHWACQIVRV